MLNEDKNYKEALNSKGITLFYQCALNNKGEYEEALECLDKILKIDPNDILVLSNKGWVLVTQEKYEVALECLVTRAEELISLIKRDYFKKYQKLISDWEKRYVEYLTNHNKKNLKK